MSDEEDRSYHLKKRPGKIYGSRRIGDPGSSRSIRIVSRVVDGDPGLRAALLNDELVLRETPAGRYEIVAKVFEDDRSIRVLTIQKYNSKSGPSDRIYFSLVGDEIKKLLAFVAGIKAIPLDDSEKFQFSDSELRGLLLDQSHLHRFFADNQDLLLEVAQSEEVTRDLVAVGYRRKQLQRFEALLRDSEFFEVEKNRLRKSPEAVWQTFFEANTWIFGYGLAFQFLTRLDERKLEQLVRGHDISGAGKRTDALMKTRGLLSSLCFIEIKRHDTPLLAKSEYRPGAWPPSSDLVGGVAQTQVAVQDAREQIGRKLTPTDALGAPTGEVIFNVEPRSFLVVGDLAEFMTAHGIHETKFRSFELYRRSIRHPEILTFDELLQRARFIVEQSR